MDSSGPAIRPGSEVFEHFYLREFRQVVALAYVLTGRGNAAEDLAQEAFTAAFRSWDRISLYEDPSGWVRRVVANRAVSLHRRWITERRFLPALLRPAPPSPAAEIDAEATQLWEAVRALPKRQAQAVALHYLDDLPLEDIGRILGCSPGTVKTHLARGRERLEHSLGVPFSEEIE